MRTSFAASLALVALPLALITLSGCRVSITDATGEEDPDSTYVAPRPPPAPSSSASTHTTLGQPTTTPAVKDAPFNEVVYVLMKDRLARTWFCTGTLVSKTSVVTAGHCLSNDFLSYEVVAPHAANKPRVAASKPAAVPGDYADPSVADIGFLTLSRPIELPAYAQLTDVTAQLEAGDAIMAQASVRSAEQPEAPLRATQTLAVSSTSEFGYTHGFGTPLFSNGGDSGAGLFLVENGVPTHKLIGVARQPDPARGLDHFTRIDADFVAWYAEKNAR